MVVSDIFKGLDGINKVLISNGGENAVDKNFFYLSGAEAGLFEGSYLVATRDNVKLFVFPLEEQLAKATGKEVVVASSPAQMKELVSKELTSEKEVGVNLASLPVNMFNSIKEMSPNTTFKDVSSSIEIARMVKSEEEVSKLKEAAKISSEVYESVLNELKEGMKETDVASLLAYKMMSNGASATAFTSIVCFGDNAAVPHHFPDARKLKKGDFVLTDYGAQYKRYCADTTRTAVFGRATEEQKEMYAVVYEAQSKSADLVRTGANGKTVNQKAFDVIDSTKYKGRLMHGIGHGIGLEVHDHGALGNADFELKENMVITDEPGVYIPGFGGVRIEDDLLVKNDGAVRITHNPPKDLIEV